LISLLYYQWVSKDEWGRIMDPKIYMQKMVESMKERTGRDLAEWVVEVRTNLPAELKGRTRFQWLKDVYGLGQNSVHVILNEMAGKGPEEAAKSDNAKVENLFVNENATIKPLYDELSAELLKRYTDLVLRPCKTYIPYYRQKQVLFIKPLKGALHIGVALPSDESHPLLQPARGLGGPERITQKLVITSKEELTDQAWALFGQAYERN
jgi:hypothetical protein